MIKKLAAISLSNAITTPLSSDVFKVFLTVYKPSSIDEIGGVMKQEIKTESCVIIEKKTIPLSSITKEEQKIILYKIQEEFVKRECERLGLTVKSK